MIMDTKKRNLRREEPLYTRLSPSEKRLVRKEATAKGLSMEEYTRCKLFDIPFEQVSGRLTKTSKVESHSDQPTATIPTA